MAEAIASVLAQTYQPLQVIVIDDGSTDASAARAQEFGVRVQYHFQVNRGTGAARNAGVTRAMGEYLAFLDQDDVWLEDKVTFQMSCLEQDPALDAVFGQVEQFYDNALAAPVARSKVQIAAGCLPSVLLIKREAFGRVGLFETEYVLGEWANWYVRAVEAGIKMGMPARVVARRRIHAGNKGVLQADARVEYAKIMGAFLQRRRKRE